MKTSDFDYELPEELIAQTPVEPRDHSRLMVVHRATGEREDKHFYDIIDYLNPNDALVINETKVIPARLLGEKEDTGVPVEVLLLRRKNQTDWEALVRPGRRLKPGTTCVSAADCSNARFWKVCRKSADASSVSIMKGFSRSCSTGWARCRCRRISTKSWRIRAAIRPFTPKMKGLPLRRRQGCTSRRSCSNASVPRA